MAGKRAVVSTAWLVYSFLDTWLFAATYRLIYFPPFMIPAPEGFRDLRDYLHQRRIDAAWIRTVLDAYLGEYEHKQTDGVDLDLDHQVHEYRRIIDDFKQLIEDDVETDDDDSGAAAPGTDPAGGVGDQAAGHAAESRSGAARATGPAPRAAQSAACLLYTSPSPRD